jgi:hypothetical protein
LEIASSLRSSKLAPALSTSCIPAVVAMTN